MTKLKQQFDTLCKQAESAYPEELENLSYESTLVNLLAFCKKHKQEKPNLVLYFQYALENNSIGIDAVAFCMRELRWLEIREYVQQQMELSSDPRSRVLNQIIEAYEEDWPDSEMYDYYSTQQLYTEST